MTKNTEVPVQQQNSNGARLAPQETPDRFLVPLADVFESPDAFLVMLDMPGTTKEGISITIDRSLLVVKGEVRAPHTSTGTLLHNEIAGLGYHRSFNLGEGVDPANVDARYEEGVLTMKLFKREEVKPKEIQIR